MFFTSLRENLLCFMQFLMLMFCNGNKKYFSLFYSNILPLNIQVVIRRNTFVFNVVYIIGNTSDKET